MTAQPTSPLVARVAGSLDSNDPDFRESIDMEAFLALDGDERKEAESILLDRLEVDDDWRIPPALAAAKSRRAVMPLRQRFPETRGRMRLAVARALVDLKALDRIDETVAEVLREGEIDGGLAALSAGQGLRSRVFRDVIAWATLYHPAPEVRSAAGAALFYLADLTSDPLAWSFRPFYLRLGDEDEAERRKAYEEICVIVGMDPAVAG